MVRQAASTAAVSMEGMRQEVRIRQRRRVERQTREPLRAKASRRAQHRSRLPQLEASRVRLRVAHSRVPLHARW
eukprot:803350-Pleurochrysis_carterae.AAC.1